MHSVELVDEPDEEVATIAWGTPRRGDSVWLDAKEYRVVRVSWYCNLQLNSERRAQGAVISVRRVRETEDELRLGGRISRLIAKWIRDTPEDLRVADLPMFAQRLVRLLG